MARKTSKKPKVNMADRQVINTYCKAVIAEINGDITARDAVWQELNKIVESHLLPRADRGALAKGVGGGISNKPVYREGRTEYQHQAQDKVRQKFGTGAYVNESIGGYHGDMDSEQAVYDAISKAWEANLKAVNANEELHFKGALDPDVKDNSFFGFMQQIGVHSYKKNHFGSKTNPASGNKVADHIGDNDLPDTDSPVDILSILILKEDDKAIHDKVWRFVKRLCKADKKLAMAWATYASGNRKGRRSEKDKTESTDFWSVMGVERATGFTRMKALHANMREYFKGDDEMQVTSYLYHYAIIMKDWLR